MAGDWASRFARAARLKHIQSTAAGFVRKFGNDWCTNLAALLAYNFLGAIFPLLLGILALAALFLPLSLVHQAASGVNHAFPPGAHGLNLDFNALLSGFRGSGASIVTIGASFAALLWTGSSLFGVMENCFSIVYRTRDRGLVRQKVMALGMIVLFVVLTPLAFVASTVSGSYRQLTTGVASLPFLGALIAAGGYLLGVGFAFVLLACIYLIVPNLPLNWRHAWPGALVAAILLEAATLVFPVYTSHFSTSQFGAIVGLLAILGLWFWLVSLILLLGAEVNSYFVLGQRAAPSDLPGLLSLATARPKPEEPGT
ncbi:MAG: YihY/virulence factor BrkB family protein [Chloroflexota bacterium]